MGNAITSFATIYNNPFIMAPLFPIFYQKLPVRNNSLLLSYLVLPLVLNPESRQFLKNAKSTSTIHTLVSSRDRMAGLSDRISSYKGLTNTSLQHAINTSALVIAADLSVATNPGRLDESLCPLNTSRAASNLSRLFAPFEVPTVYRLLGINQL